MPQRHNIEDVISVLQRAQGSDRKAALIIGAGCSKSAGIPLAKEFVEIIKNDYKDCYKRAKEKTYPGCMAALLPVERKELLEKYIDAAKINWAHMGMACLMAADIVDRIYTINFDPLAIQACALMGVFPAVYDFTAKQQFNPAAIHDKALFYLHGQRSGFIRRNTRPEVEQMAKTLAPVLRDARQSRTIIVVGYSGENDPVFDQLVETEQFDHGLFWVGYKDSEPSKNLKEKLLIEGKEAHYIKGWDADSFFIKLAKELGCLPPPLIDKPFSYLAEIYDTIMNFPISPELTDSDITLESRKWIEEAIRRYEKGEKIKSAPKKFDISQKVQEAQKLAMEGKHDQVWELGQEFKGEIPEDLADLIAWAAMMQGLDLYESVGNAPPKDEAKLLVRAGEQYAAALEIRPDMHEALNNWGLALQNQAMSQKGEEGDKLFTLANGKYAAALVSKPDNYLALYNWGTSLSHQADSKTGEEADRLYSMAYEKYAAALEIEPDMHIALHNWGTSLFHQADSKTGKEADNLLTLANEKYAAALEIKPDKHEALNNWGNALLSQAKMKTGEEADNLYQEAYEKYAAALEIKPDKHEAMIDWGTTLQYQAQTKTGKQAERLFAQAKDKFLEVEESSPGSGAYSLACLEALTDNDKECRRWLEVWREHGELPTLEYINSDSDFDSVSNKKWFKDFLKTHPDNVQK